MTNRKLPIPPDVALKSIQQTAQRAMTPARPLPKIPPWRAAPVGVAFAVLAAICVSLCLRFNSLLYAAPLMLVLLAVGWFLAYRRRCPDCKRRLLPFTEDIYGSSRYRELFRCSSCSAVWDSGKVGDHEIDENLST